MENDLRYILNKLQEIDCSVYLTALKPVVIFCLSSYLTKKIINNYSPTNIALYIVGRILNGFSGSEIDIIEVINPEFVGWAEIYRIFDIAHAKSENLSETKRTVLLWRKVGAGRKIPNNPIEVELSFIDKVRIRNVFKLPDYYFYYYF